MMDGAVDEKLLCGIDSENVYMQHGFISSGGGICNRARLRQLIAPLVKPVYGDVFVVPLSATYNASHTCAIVQSCFKEHWGVCADDSGANTKYVLKVGEASAGHLRELVALAPKELRLRCIKK
jgi:hypothetical protein